MKRNKARAIVLAAAALLTGLMATPAQASTTSNGCTVHPVTPFHNGDFTAGGIKRVAYEIDVTCVSGVSIEIQQERWEQDGGLSNDDFIGDSTLNNTFNSAGSITRTITANLPDTDDFTDLYEEMYQRVRFRVTSGPVTSGWTSWESSGVRSIHV
jgi:hypothetical protein